MRVNREIDKYLTNRQDSVSNTKAVRALLPWALWRLGGTANMIYTAGFHTSESPAAQIG